MKQFTLLEKATRRAPLGLRFLDLARDVPVTDDLVVTAWQAGAGGPGLPAIRSPLSGIYGFRSLPGLRGYEYAERPASDWCGAPPATPLPQQLLDLTALQTLYSVEENTQKANFIIYVADQAGRFLPQALSMCLPKEQLVEVPLFSSPARVAPSGFGTVRGEIVERGADPKTPASWALVTISPDNQTTTYVAVADARGMFVTFLPYASALPAPQGNGGTLNQLSWNLTIQVFYQPSQQSFIAGLALPDSPPDTLSILGQARATVYDDAATSGSDVVRPLSFGGSVVVVTTGFSQLLVDPAPKA